MDTTNDSFPRPIAPANEWDQDENAQSGIPPEEELPQEGAFDGDLMPEDVLARHADAYRYAVERQRQEHARVETQRRAFLAAVRDRANPPTPRRLCEVLQRVLSSDNASAREIAADALRLVAQISIATGKDRASLVRALLTRLRCAPYHTIAYDRMTLQGAAALARQCYFSRDNEAERGGQSRPEGGV
ncbi:MAG: hypothetical protein ACYC3Q_02820 [Gemmatimonadaceae bacterium]